MLRILFFLPFSPSLLSFVLSVECRPPHVRAFSFTMANSYISKSNIDDVSSAHQNKWRKINGQHTSIEIYISHFSNTLQALNARTTYHRIDSHQSRSLFFTVITYFAQPRGTLMIHREKNYSVTHSEEAQLARCNSTHRHISV